MHDSFVRACNYALDELSRVDIEELPRFSPERQIVFVRNYDQPVESDSHQRESEVGPNIVLLRWLHFEDLLGNSPTTPINNTTYSDSYLGSICTSKSNFKLTWRNIQSTVEMKVEELPRGEWKKSYGGGFGTLNKSAPDILLEDVIQPRFFYEELPNYRCECTSFRNCCLFASVDDTQGSEGSGTEDLPATAEDIPKAVLRYHKRRLKDPREDSGIVPAAKRTRIEAQSRERRSTQGKEDSGKGAEESSAPRAVSLDHPSSIRKGTHAAEILSCFPEITHSINFILIGEILQSKSFV